jgi:TonB family protein
LRRGLTSLAYVELGRDNGGMVSNLSEGGLGAQSAMVLTKKYLPRIRFQLPRSGKWVELGGKIAWTGESEKEAGIEFVDLPERARAEIEEWVAAGTSKPESPEEIASAGERGSKLLEMPRTRETKHWLPKPGMPDEGVENVLQALSLFQSASIRSREAEAPPAASLSTACLDKPAENAMFGLAAQTADNGMEAAMDHRRVWTLAAVGAFLAVAFFVVGIRVTHAPGDTLLRYVEHVRQSGNERVTVKVKEQPLPSVGPSASGPPAEDARQQPVLGLPGQPQTSTNAPTNAPNSGKGEAHPQPPTRLPEEFQNAKIAVQIRPSHLPRGAILVGAPEGSSPLQLGLPEEAVSASALVAITSRRLVTVPPMSGPQPFPGAESLHVGGLLFHVELGYPPEAIQKRVEGTVELHATVGRTGEIANIKLESGPMLLATAAMSAVREWRYEPTLINAQPVETEEDIKITFRLP